MQETYRSGFEDLEALRMQFDEFRSKHAIRMSIGGSTDISGLLFRKYGRPLGEVG
jgi:hypothetical protein